MTEIGRVNKHKTTHQDAGADEIDATGLAGRCVYVDRGHASAWDFTKTSFPTGGAWATLDLSGIVPLGTIAVQIQEELLDDVVGSALIFGKIGAADNYNTSALRVQVANVNIRGDLFVGVNSDRTIKYYRTNVDFTAINAIIRGWFV